jgi:MarR family transcriptional regulator, organic hydroperoxide resistance regulator
MNNDQNSGNDSAVQKRERVKSELLHIWKHIGATAHGNFSEAWMELNLTIAQLKCLFYVDREGGTNQKTIAAVLGVTPPNVTGIIDRLVEQHLVTRHENESNRRMQIIELTPKSKALLSELKERRVNHLATQLDQLTMADLEALLQGFKALAAAEKSAAENLALQAPPLYHH